MYEEFLCALHYMRSIVRNSAESFDDNDLKNNLFWKWFIITKFKEELMIILLQSHENSFQYVIKNVKYCYIKEVNIILYAYVSWRIMSMKISLHISLLFFGTSHFM